jgi:two-component system, response regulator PdtaR
LVLIGLGLGLNIVNAEKFMPRSAPATILLVEDEVLVRLVVADRLRSEGMRVIEAKSGDEALWLLASTEQIDLVVTDIRMPGTIDGVTLAQFAKKEYRLPVILASAHYEALLPTGIADAFFAKPYDMDRVFAAVVDLLQRDHP